MLLNLHIKNMALIDEIEIDFSEHLNILTGETGAGKSIIIGSVMLALGGKTPKDFVRANAPYGLVELTFFVEDEETMHKLKELGVEEFDTGELILTRKVIGTRSVSKINGETVTLAKVREVAACLLDLHAQHEHQSLLVPENHMKLLDRFGQEELFEEKEAVLTAYTAYTHIKKELAAVSMDEGEKRRQLDLLAFEAEEIAAAALHEGEDEQLEEAYKAAANGRSITEGLSTARHLIDESAQEALDRAVREMTGISEYDPALAAMTDTLAAASDLLGDYARDARAYLEEHTFSDAEFRALEDRLNTVNHLKAKYGKTIPDVLRYGQTVQEKYDRLRNQEADRERLEQELVASRKTLSAACDHLTRKRKLVAERLCENIRAALADLNFLSVRFEMVFETLPSCTANGLDYAYFVISTNVGESVKPLWQVASGGELSRIMLAIKSVLADVDGIETLIFDEIDVGISGRTAQMVAEKIRGIAKRHQVICITHLPQIAAMANTHFLIEKQVQDGKTVTDIYRLDETRQIYELARLIGGVKITDTVLQSAKEMKELAAQANVD